MEQTIQAWLAAFLIDGAVDPDATYAAGPAKTVADHFAAWLAAQ